MINKKKLFANHFKAIVFSVIFTSILPFILYFILFLVLDENSDAGSPLMFLLIPLVNFIIALLILTIVFLPLFLLSEKLLNKWYSILRWIAIIFLSFGIFIIFITFYGLLRNILGDLTFLLTEEEYFSVYLFLFFGSIPLLIGSPIYWLTLRKSYGVPNTRENA